MAEDSSPAPQTTPASNYWAKTALWVCLTLILVAGGAFLFKSCIEAPGKVIDKAGTALEKVLSAFNRGAITTSFISYATTLSNSLHLQFATLNQMEIFTRKEETSTAFGYIPLPDVVVEARAPVEYNYYLDLNEPWRFMVKESTIFVFPPAIKFNKPAVDASAITYDVKKGYFKTAEAQEKLKQSITSLVRLRARENIHLVREVGRKQTTDFVEHWLIKTFADGKDYHVKVYFPDERPPSEPPLSAPPLK